MGCFKRLGERVMVRDFDWRVTELQVRAFILNRFTSRERLRLCAWHSCAWSKVGSSSWRVMQQRWGDI